MLDRPVRVGTLVVACLSVTVFFGELFDVALLTGPVAGLAAMKVNTACGLLAAAIALWFLYTCAPGIAVDPSRASIRHDRGLNRRPHSGGGSLCHRAWH
jgi:hypothetical protein